MSRRGPGPVGRAWTSSRRPPAEGALGNPAVRHDGGARRRRPAGKAQGASSVTQCVCLCVCVRRRPSGGGWARVRASALQRRRHRQEFTDSAHRALPGGRRHGRPLRFLPDLHSSRARPRHGGTALRAPVPVRQAPPRSTRRSTHPSYSTQGERTKSNALLSVNLALFRCCQCIQRAAASTSDASWIFLRR